MYVKELRKLLKGVDGNCQVIVDVNGSSMYTLDTEETDEQKEYWVEDKFQFCLITSHRLGLIK